MLPNINFGGGRSDIAPATDVIWPDHEGIVFSSYAGTLTRTTSFAALVRPINDGVDGLRFAAPNMRASLNLFLAEKGRVEIDLEFTGLMTRADIYSAGGVVLVDGLAHDYDFPSPDGSIPTGLLTVNVVMEAGDHTLSIVWPIAASMRLRDIRIPDTAAMSAPPTPPAARVVLLGDSRFNGMGVNNVRDSLAYELQARVGAQVVNLANGGRQLEPDDFTIAGAEAADLTLSLYDFNNFYPNGASIAAFEAAYETAIGNFRAAATTAGRATAPLKVVTSFASTSDHDWAGAPGPYIGNSPTLEAFRTAERDAVTDAADAYTTIIEGRGVGMPDAGPTRSTDGVHFIAIGQAMQASAIAVQSGL